MSIKMLKHFLDLTFSNRINVRMIRCDFITDWRTGLDNQHVGAPEQGVCEQKQVKSSIEHKEASKQSVCERKRSLNSEVENSSCESSGDESEIEYEEPVQKKRQVDHFNELYDNIKLKVEKRMQENEEHFESPDSF